jgi:hypothetical protein
MSNPDAPKAPLSPEPVLDLSQMETQRLRRRVAFWRRMAGVLAGGIALVLFVAWNRSQVRRHECRASLELYALEAKEANLTAQHPGILEAQWQNLPPMSSGFAPQHYDLIVSNWAIEPGPDDRVPLAVCRDSHTALFSRGRNTLAHTSKGIGVFWARSETADRLATDAAKDNLLLK